MSNTTTTEGFTTETVSTTSTTDVVTTVSPTTTTITTTTTSQSDVSTTTNKTVFNYDDGAFGVVYPLLGNTPPTSQMYSTIASQASNHPVTVILNPDTIECVGSSFETGLNVLKSSGVTILGYLSVEGSPDVT